MNMPNHETFSCQAAGIRTLGSSFVAAVLEAGQRQLACAPLTAALIATWPGDPAAAALAMRFNGALHALARRDGTSYLGALYHGAHDDFDGAIGGAMAKEDAFIAAWMRDPPQTNEVGRAASIVAALMVAQAATGGNFELLELGSSAGLNLNLAHYAYDLGGVTTGALDSDVRIAPVWRGPPPPAAAFNIVSARGVDLLPLDVALSSTRERLLSYVWADEPKRAERLQQAIDLARSHPPSIDRSDVVTWLREQLGVLQPIGTCRAVFHSMLMQYLTADDRRIATDMIARAGDRATIERPMAWISFEWNASRTHVQLWLTYWPGGVARHLATCHPYGAWVEWHG